MKKEITVAALFVAMFVLAVVNIGSVSRLTVGVTRLADTCAVNAESGDWDAAKTNALRAYEKWRDAESYTRLILRHSELEDAGDALAELLGATLNREAGAVRGAALMVEAHMSNIAHIEQIHPGSIF
ncbi:MAG: DUF4363 family protein [Oscillospiraceae bacterium]|jgi:hypothetical protein|nr:DUF4363 family protein [Oscillospiraceae bacterium]